MQPCVRDPYEILGVSRDADGEALKAAFRRLAREHHPDRNPGDEGAQSRFQEINAAYQLLSDPQRRAAFDRFGTDRPGAAAANGGVGAVRLDELLSELFGGWGRRPTHNGDMRLVLDLTFEEAALGCTKPLRYERLDRCRRCDGDGAEPDTALSTCASCQGSGRVAVAAAGWFVLQTQTPCPACTGRGRVPQQRCHDCAGKGLVAHRRTIEVQVPPGIESGATQTIPNGGSRVRPAGPSGDLELVIRILEHPSYRREGDDVLSELALSFTTLALGGDVEVRTLHGPRPLRVPPGTQPGVELKLRGEGVPHRFRAGRGDHRVRVRLQVPTRLTEHAKTLVQEFDAAQGDYEETGLLGRLKGLFSGD